MKSLERYGEVLHEEKWYALREYKDELKGKVSEAIPKRKLPKHESYIISGILQLADRGTRQTWRT